MKKELKGIIGYEGSVIELSNELVALGCEDICEFGNWSDLLETGNVVIATDEFGEENIIMDFEVIYPSGEDEVIEATIVKVINVQDF